MSTTTAVNKSKSKVTASSKIAKAHAPATPKVTKTAKPKKEVSVKAVELPTPLQELMADTSVEAAVNEPTELATYATQAEIDGALAQLHLNEVPVVHTSKPINLPQPKAPRVLFTTEEKKAKRNAAQQLLRSTPEGKAYANNASKKSIAAKKARVQAELDSLKALVAAIAPVVV